MPFSRRRLTWIVWCLLILTSGLPGWAQEAEKPASAPGERIIYVPFSQLEKTFEKPDSSVVLPYEEYLKLRKQWEQAQKPPRPVEVVFTQADYVGTVEKDFARITLTLQANVLGPAWSRVPVNFGHAAIGKVTGDDVLLRGTGEGHYELIFGKTGKQTVTLELGLLVSQSPDGRSFSFACPPVAMQTMEMTVPDADQTVEINPAGVRVPVEEQPEKATRVRVNTGATEKISVSWHAKASQKPEMDLLTSVTNRTLVTIEDGSIHTDAWLTYDVLRGQLEQFQLAVPKDHRILDINANVRLKSWKPTEKDGRQVVDVVLLSPSSKPVTLDVHTQRKLTADAFDVIGLGDDGETLGIHAIDAVRESGQLAVRHGSDLTVTVVDQEGLIRIEEGAVDKTLAGNNALAFKFYSPRLKLKLLARPVEPRITVAHTAQLVFTEDELSSDSMLQYQIERAGVFELRVQLPEDFTVDAVNCAAMKDYNIDQTSGTLTVTLSQRHMGPLDVQIKGHREFDASQDTTEQTLPFVEPLNVERETGSVFVFAKEAIEVVTSQEGLQGAQPLPSAPRMLNSARLASAWSFTRRPLTIPVSTIRKPTRLSARVASTIDVQPEVTEVRNELRFLVEYAGTDTFHIAVPESANDRVRIEVGEGSSVAIKQKTAAEPADGWVVWTIVMQREVLGTQVFNVSWHQQSAAESPEDMDAASDTEGAAAPESTTMPLVRPLGMLDDSGDVKTPLSKVYGEVAVTSDRSLSLTTTAAGAEIEPIDIRELQILPQVGTQAFRYFKLDATGTPTVSITQMRHEIQEVVATIVSRVLVEVVTDEDAEATYRCRMQVKSTERQRLLVHLPIDMQVLGCFVNEREVKLEKAELENNDQGGPLWEPYWVNVARAGSSDEPFMLTFQFLWKVNPALGDSRFGRGRLGLPLPWLGGQGSAAAVQELKVVLWVPQEYALVGDPDHFTLHQVRRSLSDVVLGSRPDHDARNLEDWIQMGRECATGFLQFPTRGRQPYIYTNLGGATLVRVVWWNRLTMTLIFSGAAALIGLILITTPWENKLSILLLGTFAAVLYGVSDSQGLYSGINAAQYGLVVLVGLWLIHSLFVGLKSWRPQVVPLAENGPVAEVAPAEVSSVSDLSQQTEEASPQQVEPSSEEDPESQS
ncbi:MAG: hypothetical protein KDA90_00895 [Planctomycetaceae bacterium]|nr:hypothetical protein [Planctomycetaceae bacterium]